MPAAADRNLLFGILALQMDFIARDQLVAAMYDWVPDKTRPLGRILLDRKALSPDTHALLDALVQKHLALHDDDAQKSLAAVSSVGSVQKCLAEISDADVQASLIQMAKPRAESANHAAEDDADATVGTPRSTGLRFRIVRPHARGGLGEVFVAHDAELHREVALKEIRVRHADNMEARTRFLLEAEITGGLEHPGIVPVYGLGQYADGRPFYAMRFIQGDSLKDAIERFHHPKPRGESSNPAGSTDAESSLGLRKLLGRFIDVCEAIQYAHDRGVLHRDLKPGNIMLGKYGETLVVDWGLAKTGVQRGEPAASANGAPEPEVFAMVESPLLPASASGSSETLPGSAIGTPSFMSPEQAAGRLDRLGPASDVYSLGATLYMLLTGKPPVEGKDVAATLKRVRAGDIPRPRLLVPNVDRGLEAICLKAMALKPANRYRTPRALADDLERWLADKPVFAWAEPWTVRGRRWARQHQTLVTSTAASLFITLAALTAGLLWYQDEQNRRSSEQALHQAVTEESIRHALDEADKPRQELHAILAKPGGVFGLLDEPARWEAYIQTANTSLHAAQDLLANADAGLDRLLVDRTAKLKEALRQDDADRLLAVRLEKIRLDRSTKVDGKYDHKRAAEHYASAFAEAGLGILKALPAASAAQVAASPIKEQLVAALDGWAWVEFTLGKKGMPEQLLEVCRRAAPDPAWGDRIRQVEIWRNQQALVELAEKAPAAGLSAPLLELIGTLLADESQLKKSWYRQAQARYPTDFWLNFNLGKALAKVAPAEAAGYFRVALAVRPRSSVAYNNLGVALYYQKKLPEAIAAFQKVIELDPQHAGAYNNLGGVFYEQRKLPEAIAAFEKAIDLDWHYAGAYNNLGNVLREQKKLTQASAAYQKAIELDAEDAGAYSNLGTVLREQKKPTEAIKAFQKAIQLDSKFALAHYNLGNAFYDQRSLAEASAAFQKAIESDPKNAAAYNNLGNVLRDQGQMPKASAAYRKALQLDPKLAPTLARNYLSLGFALRERKQLSDAIAAFQKVAEIDPKHVVAYRNLGMTFRELKRLPEAIAAYQKVVELDPKSAASYNALGNALLEHKKLPEAIAAFEKAVKLDPKLSIAYRKLGAILWEQKRQPEAIAAYQMVVEIEPNDIEAYTFLGSALLLQKKLPEAIAAFQKAVELDPENGVCHGGMGGAFLLQGSFAEAATACQKALDFLPPNHPSRGSFATLLKESRNCLSLEKRLPLALKGNATSTRELLEMARLCREYKSRHAQAVRLYQEAFKAEPAFQEAQKPYRYNAACSAALAGTGQGAEAGSLPAEEKTKLRQEARAWLQADLDRHATKVKEGSAPAILQAEQSLSHWQGDADLAAVRDAKPLAALPEPEQAAWRKLWADVDQLLKQIRAAITETTRTGALTDQQHEQVHDMRMEGGKSYIIEMRSKEFDSYLKLHDGVGRLRAENDDIAYPENLDARIIFTPTVGGTFRITATSFQERGRGAYTLSIRAIGGKGK